MKKYLCIDIGGTSIKYGIFNEDGDLLHQLPSDRTNNAIEETNIVNTLRRKINQESTAHKLEGICISTAGVVNDETGQIIYSGYTIPNYTNTKLKEIIEIEFGLPCEVENDVNAACLGEYWKGALRGASSAVCLTVGTGVGGAVLFQDQIVHGIGFTAGEVGYLNVNGGRFQDLASTSALVDRVNRRKQIDLDGVQIFELAKAGDEICIEEIDFLVENLSIGIVNIFYLLNPERLVLGGGIMAQEAYLKPKIQQRIAGKIQDSMFNKTELKFAELKNNAGMVGALYNFKKRR